MTLERLKLSNLNAPADQFIAVRDKYDLNPPYQRGSVWTVEQRISLLRSLFMGLPIGAVVVNVRPFAPGDAHYVVVDGKQRIETLRAYVDEEFAIPADWFEPGDVRSTVPAELTSFGAPGVLYSGLNGYYQRTFEDFGIATLQAHVATIADEAVLYGLINTGGTVQTDADLARAAAVANEN